MHPRLDRIDRRIASWMDRWGHGVHRVTLGLVFVWFGALKVLGYKTATSVIAQTIYWGDPAFMVPVLGVWEVGIGLAMMFRPTVRIAILLLAIRLPGTFLALVLLPEVAFEGGPLTPTPAGQYLIKDLMLFGAALVIGGTVRHERGSGGGLGGRKG